MEIWKDIVGYENKYQISNLGNVKSLVYGKNRILKPGINNQGYLGVILYKNNKSKGYRINRLVALVFLNNFENKKEVNHKNGIKNDNRLENLEWCTASENIQHRNKILGFKSVFEINNPMKGKVGILHHRSKKINQYNLNGEFIKTWDYIKQVKEVLKIDSSYIVKVCKGKRKTAGGFIWKYT